MSILNKISSIIGTETDLKQSALPLSILSGLVLIIFFLIAGELREFFEAGGPVLWYSFGHNDYVDIDHRTILVF